MMYEVVFVLYERPDCPREAALSHWRTTHVEHVWRIPKVRGYRQTWDYLGPGQPPFLGLAVLQFAAEADFQEAAASEAFAAAVADLTLFADPERLPTFSLVETLAPAAEGA
jgi:uncharacterized protein (TIGR02118 family)